MSCKPDGAVYGSGKHLSHEHVIAWTREHSPPPYFGFWEFTIGAGKNIGGYVLDGFLKG